MAIVMDVKEITQPNQQNPISTTMGAHTRLALLLSLSVTPNGTIPGLVVPWTGTMRQTEEKSTSFLEVAVQWVYALCWMRHMTGNECPD